MTESGSSGRGPTESDIHAAIEEASRSLGVPPEAPSGPEGPGEPEPGRGRVMGRLRPAWVVTGLLVVAVVAALVLRGSGTRGQPAHLVEADLRWAVAQVVDHVEEERLLRGRLPAESDLRVLLSEAVSYSAEDGSYRVVGRRDGVRVEYDGTVPLEEWSATPPDTVSR